MDYIAFRGIKYPFYQAEGNAARFIIPMAKEWCRGIGYDIGCNRIDWALPGAIPIDIKFSTRYHAMKLPCDGSNTKVDFIFSSHCLEHINTPWHVVLHYWSKHIRPGGVLFLYLPDYSQEYWRPWNNNKHNQVMEPRHIHDCLKHYGYNVKISGVDLNNSFCVVGEKL